MPLLKGQEIREYRLLEPLGAGGMATVYKAFHARLNRAVAIKMIHIGYSDDQAFLVRFEREAQIAAALEHPNIVPVYDYFEHEGKPCLVMKYIEGCSLKQALADGPLLIEDTMRIMPQVASALDTAHQMGVLHRDIKPSNILLDMKGMPYIADFGLAKLSLSGATTISENMLIGTPFYMSPEQGKSDGQITTRSDLYSFGIMLYELLVGRVPFNDGTPYAIIHDHIYSLLPLPTTLNAQITPAVENVLLTALQKNPEDRYESAAAMMNALREAVAGTSLLTVNLKSASATPNAAGDVERHSLAESIIRHNPANNPRPTSAVVTPGGNTPLRLKTRPQVDTRSVAAPVQSTPEPRPRRWLWIVGALLLMFGACAVIRDGRQEEALIAAAQTSTAQRVEVEAPAVPSENLPQTTPEVDEPRPPGGGQPGQGGAPPSLLFIPPMSISDAQAEVDANPDEAIAYLTLARAYIAQNRLDAADDILREGIQYAPDPVEYLASAGAAAVELQRIPAALLVYDSVLQASKGTPQQPNMARRAQAADSLYRLVTTQDDLTPLQIRSIVVVVERTNAIQDPLIIVMVARSLLANDRISEARDLFDSPLVQQSTASELRLIGGEISLAEGNIEDARADFEFLTSGAPAPRWAIDRARELLDDLPTPAPN